MPESIAFAGVNQLKSELQANAQSTQRKQAVFALLIVGVAVCAVVIFVGTITRPLNQMRDRIFNLSSADGDLTQVLNVKNHRELIEISQGVNQFISKLREMILTLREQNLQVQKQTTLLKEATEITTETISRQTEETNSVATAMEEMAYTSAEVARLASTSAEGTRVSEKILQSTQEKFDYSVEQVQAITQAMLENSERISLVSTRSNDINQIVSTISGIAEQTNLLALNAAIEAARAGEQGRGFAVVADEVRALAASTQKSTQEISDLVNRLQSDVHEAVEHIESNRARSEQASHSITQSVEALKELAAQVVLIADNTVQVASAAEQQSQVNTEISKSVTGIGDTANELNHQAQAIDGVSQHLISVADLLDEQLARFKV